MNTKIPMNPSPSPAPHRSEVQPRTPRRYILLAILAPPTITTIIMTIWTDDVVAGVTVVVAILITVITGAMDTGGANTLEFSVLLRCAHPKNNSQSIFLRSAQSNVTKPS